MFKINDRVYKSQINTFGIGTNTIYYYEWVDATE